MKDTVLAEKNSDNPFTYSKPEKTLEVTCFYNGLSSSLLLVYNT